MASLHSSPVIEAVPQSSPTKKPRTTAAPGEFCSLTKLLGGHCPISQDVFTRAISRPGITSKDVCTLFEFYRPVKRPSAMTSSILRLTDKQHDVLYALSGCSDVACTMSKVDKKTRKALLHVYGIDKTQFSTWFKNRRPKPRKDGSRREVTIPTLPAGAEARPAGNCDAAADLLLESQQRQHAGASCHGGSWAGSLTGAAPLPGHPDHDSFAPQLSPTGADRKRRPSACSRQNSPIKVARSPSAADSLPRVASHLDEGHAAHGASHLLKDPVPNHFLPQSRHQAQQYHQQYHAHHQEGLQTVYEGSYAPSGALPRINTAPGPHVFRQQHTHPASRSWDGVQVAAAAQGPADWFDLPEWPHSPSDSSEQRDMSMLVLSQSAIAAVAADAAAAAEEASGLLPVQMRGRSQSYPGGGANISMPQPGFLQQQRGGAVTGYPAPANAGAASKIAAYNMRAQDNMRAQANRTMPGYGSDLPHAPHHGKSLGGFSMASASPWAHAQAAHAAARQYNAPHPGPAPTVEQRGHMAPNKPPASQRLVPCPSAPARWAPDYASWGSAVTSGATITSPRGPAAVSRAYSMPYHDSVYHESVDVKPGRDAVDMMAAMPSSHCISAPEHAMPMDAHSEELVHCTSPSWGMQQQDKARKTLLTSSPDATPLNIGDGWPTESTAELEGFDLNAFGFLDDLSME